MNNNIFSYKVLDKTILINSINGNFSCDINNLELNSNFKVFEDIRFLNLGDTITFCLEITNKCNMNCNYCFRDKDKQASLNKKACKDILDLLFKLFSDKKKYFIDLSGDGEPLLNKDIIDYIYNYCRSKSNELYKEIIINFVCNGTLLSEDNVKFLQKREIIFGVSIDGLENIHNKNRTFLSKKKNNYRLIINNIKKIKYKEFLGCSVVLTNEVFSIVKSIKILSKYFKTISFKFVRSKKIFTEEFPIIDWIYEYKKLTLFLINNIKKNNYKILYSILNGDDLFGKFIERCFLNVKAISRCDQGIKRLFVDLNGNIFGCPALSEFGKNAIIDINNYNFIDYFKDNLKRENNCEECNFRFICGGFCSVEKFYYIWINKIKCSLIQELIKLAMYFKETLEIENYDAYIKIYDFLIEKRKRLGVNTELYEYLRNAMDRNLSFLELKKEFYDKKDKTYHIK